MDKIEIQFLGSGDAFGSGGRLKSCIFIKYGKMKLLLDCGTSALISMNKFGVNQMKLT